MDNPTLFRDCLKQGDLLTKNNIDPVIWRSVLNEITRDIDLHDLDEVRILSQVDIFCSKKNIAAEEKAAIFSLLNTGLEIIKRMMRCRDFVLSELRDELSDNIDDPEEEHQIRREIAILETLVSFNLCHNLLCDRNAAYREGIFPDVPVDEIIIETQDKISIVDAYRFLSDSDRAFCSSMEPSNFAIDSNNFSDQQRNWILAVVALTPENSDKKTIRKLLASVFKCTVHKIGACTAYLVGDCRRRVSEPGLLSMIQSIEVRLNGTAVDETVGDIPGVEVNAVIEVNDRAAGETDPNYDNEAKRLGWRIPEEAMIKRAFGRHSPLRGKRILLLEAPALLEWKMLEKLGADQNHLTIVERFEPSYRELRCLLPVANVIYDDLDHYLAVMADERLAHRRAQLREWGVSPEDPSSYVIPKTKRLIGLNPETFRGLQIADDSKDFFENPETEIQHNFQIPEIAEDQFDLISFDTKGLFDSGIMTVMLMFKMGLLKPNSVLATNFMAQREAGRAKKVYNGSLAAAQLMEQRETDWMSVATDGTFKEARSLAISLRLIEIAQSGQSMFKAMSDAPGDPLFEAIRGDVMNLGFSPTIAAKLDRYSEVYGHYRDGVFNVPERDTSKIHVEMLWEILFDVAYRQRCAAVFGPMVKQLRAKKDNKKMSQLVYPDMKPPGEDSRENLKKWLESSYGSRVSDLIYVDRSGSMTAQAHDATVYRGGRVNMHADFLHYRRTTDNVELRRPTLDSLQARLLEGRALVGNNKISSLLLNAMWRLASEQTHLHNLRTAMTRRVI